jgi:uncharacterized membrane protein YeaQ/YmgE (transglycosylase-associated protein family)
VALLSPAFVLAALTATFHAALYVLIRNRFERHVLVAWLAAIVGALAANALGARLGGDPLRIGDFNVLWASAGAWVAIGAVSLLSLLGPPLSRSSRR